MVKFSEDHGIRWSTHFAEAPGEREFLLEGKGPLKDFLDSMGVWDGTFPVPETSGLDLLESSGVLDERCLLVHGLHMTPDELIRVSESGASMCICPRSNHFLGLPPPRPVDLLASGINVCLGTDSKASNQDLSIWGEMRAVRELEPTLSSRDILEMATLRGAEALGMSHLAGSLQPGLPNRVLVVDASGLGKDDPHDFLVSEAVEPLVKHLD
jgi:cytosine/adenosine deaminase-related metal-dependent hydrolase